MISNIKNCTNEKIYEYFVEKYKLVKIIYK